MLHQEQLELAEVGCRRLQFDLSNLLEWERLSDHQRDSHGGHPLQKQNKYHVI